MVRDSCLVPEAADVVGEGSAAKEIAFGISKSAKVEEQYAEAHMPLDPERPALEAALGDRERPPEFVDRTLILPFEPGAEIGRLEPCADLQQAVAELRRERLRLAQEGTGLDGAGLLEVDVRERDKRSAAQVAPADRESLLRDLGELILRLLEVALRDQDSVRGADGRRRPSPDGAR